MLILLYSFIIHVIFLLSVFEIYFKSPIINGIKSQSNSIPAVAERLVLFIGDGLRADKFFEGGSSNAPYLRNIIENYGRWGISHTRLPTESRPGHVALIAGFYEDPSAIFKGWKDNPVEFDTVFNRTEHTYAWGSPDILLMFSRGAAKERVNVSTYSDELQDISGKSGTATLLSNWSFEKFQETLMNAESDISLRTELKKSKIIFFLHLLGTDISGHADKPNSKEYAENILVCDRIVRRTQELMDKFYRDNKTAYIFTSDHGMTDWGSHGDGSKSETETPFVAWGSGIQGPSKGTNNSPLSWKLNHLERNDVNQADVPPLMSVLLGIPIPVNSIGELQINFLNTSLEYKSKGVLLNAMQIYNQYIAKMELVRKDLFEWLHIPFDRIHEESQILQSIQRSIENENWMHLIANSRKLLELSSAGLKYYHNYYMWILLFMTATSYIGWISWLLISLHQTDLKGQPKVSNVTDLCFLTLICITCTLVKAISLPPMYYVYFTLPLVIYRGIIKKFKEFSKMEITFEKSHIVATIGYAIVIEILVLSFFYRWMLSVLMISLTLWPFVYNRLPRRSVVVHISWCGTCILLSVFPLLPIIGGNPNIVFILLTGLIWLTCMVSVMFTYPNIVLFRIQFIGILLTLFNTYVVTYDHRNKAGLSFLNQTVSWLLILIVPILPLFGPLDLLVRIWSICCSLGTILLLFAVSHEALFFPILAIHLITWILMECCVDNKDLEGFLISRFVFNKKSTRKKITANDFRRALFFFFYIFYCFFGTGNLASVNSFDVSSVRCFISVFSPFVIMSLMLFKIIIPFLMTTCVFRVLNTLLEVSSRKIFLIVLIYCNVMGLNFLFLVKNEGSWLDIGSSVSHFVIAHVITLFLLILYLISYYLINIVLSIPMIRNKRNLIKFH